MNFDDFESELRRQPIQSVPFAWRNEILAAARQAGEPPVAPRLSLAAVLRDWLWPHPVAWGGLAAAWGLIFALNLAASGTSPVSIWPASRAFASFGNYWQAQQKLVSELLDFPDAEPALPPRRLVAPRGTNSDSSFIEPHDYAQMA